MALISVVNIYNPINEYLIDVNQCFELYQLTVAIKLMSVFFTLL